MTILPPPERWAPLFERHGTLFGDLEDGARIGIAARDEIRGPAASMVVWEARGGRMAASGRPFPGFRDAGVDVLLVGDGESIAALEDELDGDPLPTLKGLVRKGGIVCYVLRRQCELLEAGFEDVLQSLGVAFLGACR